ncbi:MAG: response regulator transcription factor [Bacteroidetes bacterium]|nr:response regulator transcription factor [Bacteroidota bacterium]
MKDLRILLVEDEENLQEAIKLNLELENYEVVATASGLEALNFFKEQRFNLIILDIMLPEIDGLQICENIRLENAEVPILFLTAKNSTHDKIAGLRLGADDYITKPFNLQEFLLRVKALIRRTVKPTAEENIFQTYEFGGNKVNFATYEANTKEGLVHLTKKEARLLKLLIERKDEVVSREHILQSVWGYDVYPSTRTIDNFILSFRKYFEEDPRNPIYFHSVRGIGYRFTET